MVGLLGSRDFGVSSARSRAVDSAVSYIEMNFHRPLTLALVAQSACMSRFHFSRVFRASTGMSPMEYIRWRRVAEAKRRLKAGSESLLRLAADLGYYDQSHFSRCFREATGFPPSEYVQSLESK